MVSFDGVHHESVPSWSDYKSHAFNIIARAQQMALGLASPPSLNAKKFVFRGQGNSIWRLETSFDRRWRLNSSSGKSTVDLAYARCFQDFIDDCDYYGIREEVPQALSPSDYLEQRGQHHGFPTRLLDWSSSPYIAAFFAYADSHFSTTGEVSIWALDVENMEARFRPNDVSYIHNPLSNNARMRMQMGSFTKNLTNLPFLDDVFLHKNGRIRGNLEYPIVYHIKLPSSESEYALEDLSSMGIDYTRLFPGIEGICRNYQMLTDRGRFV